MPEPKAYLLDTGILIIYARGKDAAAEIESQFHLAASAFKPIVSIVTIGEVMAFAVRNGWGPPSMARLEKLVSELVVLDISSPEILQAYADISVACSGSGKSIGNNDLWIAATVHVTGAVLLTVDKDFDPLQGQFLDRILFDPKTGKVV